MSNIFAVGRGPKIYKNWTNNGVKIWGDAAKIGKNTNLLVIMCVRLSHKIGLLDLTNRTQFKKLNGYKYVQKCVRLLGNVFNVTYAVYVLHAHK